MEYFEIKEKNTMKTKLFLSQNLPLSKNDSAMGGVIEDRIT